MKRIPLAVSLACLAALIAAVPVQAAKPTLAGGWTGNDPAPPDGDGSRLFLTVSGGHTARITFIDTFGTVCENFGAPSTVFVSRIAGEVSGNVIEGSFQWARCGSTVLDFLEGAPVTYVYDPGTDTLDDGFTTFHRHSH